MRRLWAIQYRFYRWLQERTRPPRDVEDFLLAYPGTRWSLWVVTLKMEAVFGPYPVKPSLYCDPECGGRELHLEACVPATMSYQEADRLLDQVYDWLYEQDDYLHLTEHIHVRFDWTE